MKLSFKECAELIYAVGESQTVMVEGPMGTGKSALGKYIIEKYLPDHNLIIFDCSVRSEGDVALPWLVEINGQKITTYAPTELLGLHLDKPSLIILDELPKAPPLLLNQMLPLFLERRFNNMPLKAGTFICATGNLASELLGDSLPDHVLNRLMIVEMRKHMVVDDQGRPDEWLRDFAIPAGMHPAATAFVIEFPQIFAEHSEATKNNPYIHHPGQVAGQFVTFRSFFNMAMNHVPKRTQMSENAFFAGMVGMVGKACATDFLTFLRTDLDMPRTEDIVADPTNCRLPHNKVEELIMVYRLAQQVSAKTISQIVTYVKRMDGEQRALFTYLVTNTPGTISLLPQMYRLGMINDNADLRTA